MSALEAPGIVRNGIDVLAEDGFAPIRYQKVALVTNNAALTLDGIRSVDAIYARDEIQLVALFAPQHGLSGKAGGNVADAVDTPTGLPVFSLYGPRKAPALRQLADIEILIYDLQDVGCRFYTYISTLGHVLESCAEAGVSVHVLDRPNPVDGYNVEGPSSDPARESFLAYHSMPLRHGMTVGELARLFNRERRIEANLRVVTMAGWQRGFRFEHTGQQWVDPSPNIRSPRAAMLYPGVGLLEDTNVSVGRGTDTPFELIGAPWLNGHQLADALAARRIEGVEFEAGSFTPAAGAEPYGGRNCNGVRFALTNPAQFSPCDLALALIEILRAAYPNIWEYQKIDRLLARPDLLDAIEDQAEELEDLWRPDPEFFDIRARYLLY